MAKKEDSQEWMLARVNEYLSGMGSYESIAAASRKWNKKFNFTMFDCQVSESRTSSISRDGRK